MKYMLSTGRLMEGKSAVVVRIKRSEYGDIESHRMVHDTFLFQDTLLLSYRCQPMFDLMELKLSVTRKNSVQMMIARLFHYIRLMIITLY